MKSVLWLAIALLALAAPAHAQAFPNADVVVPELGVPLGELLAGINATMEAHAAERPPPDGAHFARLTAEQLTTLLPSRRWMAGGTEEWRRFEPGGVLRSLIETHPGPGQEVAGSWAVRDGALCMSLTAAEPEQCVDVYGHRAVLLLAGREPGFRVLMDMLVDEPTTVAVERATSGGGESPR